MFGGISLIIIFVLSLLLGSGITSGDQKKTVLESKESGYAGVIYVVTNCASVISFGITASTGLHTGVFHTVKSCYDTRINGPAERGGVVTLTSTNSN
jgi:hypothetical protein